MQWGMLLPQVDINDIPDLKVLTALLSVLVLWIMAVCVCVYLSVLLADCVLTGAGWCSQETEAGLQAGAGGGLHESGELRTTLPRAHWEETPSETEPCLSEDLSPSFSSCDFLPLPFKDDFFLDLFSASSSPRNILFSTSSLLHRLVYLNISEGWFRAEVGFTRSAMWGIPQLHHRESFKGWLLESWPYWHTSVPLLEEKRGKTFLCCLQEFTLLGDSLKTTMLGVHFVENFLQNRIVKMKPSSIVQFIVVLYSNQSRGNIRNDDCKPN